MHDVEETGIDRLLEAVDLRLDAFAVCEIGKHASIQCAAQASVVIHFVLNGEGSIECENGSFPLRPGSVVVVPKGLAKTISGAGPVQQVFEAAIACPLEDGLVSFRAPRGDVDLVLGCAMLSAAIGDELPIFRHIKGITLDCSHEHILGPIFLALVEELRQPRLGTRAFVSALMKQILIVLWRSQRGRDQSAFDPMMNSRFAGVLAGVLRSPEVSHTVDSLASSAGMSRSSFSHHFSAAFDRSPKEFVQIVRLASAAKLLQGSDLPIKTVAASVGYASRSHFSRIFHAKYGVDPSTFRQYSRADAE